MKGHLSLSTLEPASSKSVVPDSLLDVICLHFDNKPEDSLGLQFIFVVADLLLNSKTWLNPANGE